MSFINIEPAKCVQECMLCENTREMPIGYGNKYPWVCDECKEAIVFLKGFIKSCDEAQKMLDEMKDPTKNI